MNIYRLGPEYIDGIFKAVFGAMSCLMCENVQVKKRYLEYG